MSHIFNVNGENVNFICSMTGDYDTPADVIVNVKCMEFLQELDIFYSEHFVLHSVSESKSFFWVKISD